MRLLAVISLCLAIAPAFAQTVPVSSADTLHSVMAAQKGKRVTLRLRSGQELTGTVREANERLVVLGELGGREFFDAVLPVSAIDAVMIRTRQ
jgi:hypothetical protein